MTVIFVCAHLRVSWRSVAGLTSGNWKCDICGQVFTPLSPEQWRAYELEHEAVCRNFRFPEEARPELWDAYNNVEANKT